MLSGIPSTLKSLTSSAAFLHSKHRVTWEPDTGFDDVKNEPQEKAERANPQGAKSQTSFPGQPTLASNNQCHVSITQSSITTEMLSALCDGGESCHKLEFEVMLACSFVMKLEINSRIRISGSAMQWLKWRSLRRPAYFVSFGYMQLKILPGKPADRTNQLINKDISHQSSNKSTTGRSKQPLVEESFMHSCDKKSIA